MNQTRSNTYMYETWHLIGALAIALLLYTSLKWYQMPAPPGAPQSHALRMQQANRAYQQGQSFHTQGDYAQALAQYTNAIELYPSHAPAHTMLSLIKLRMNEASPALEHATKAVQANSAYMPAYQALGQSYIQLHQQEQAKATYQRALKIDPNHFESHLTLAQLLGREMTHESSTKAIYHAKQALRIQPNNSDAQFALGDAHLSAGRPRDARIAYEKINQPSSMHRTKLCIGQTYEREQNYAQAATYYKHAVAYNQSHAQSHVALAGAQFALGNLAEGFKEYEWRWHLSNMRNLQHKWAGEDVKDKKIVVLSENGLGDIIQYIRFAKLLKDRGAWVSVVASKPLLSLFALCPYIDELVEVGTKINTFDYVTSMQSIPAILNINKTTLPTEPYLYADETLVDKWHSKLAADTHFKIGLCWQPGDDSYLAVDQKRGLSLNLLKPLAQKGVSFYCLQMGDNTKEQIAHAPFKINSFDEDFDKAHGPFMDTAAVMKNMDLIITVDTSVAHLAGALGVPTWLMLSYAADVRWMIDTDQSIWYPSMKLFRQPKMGDWHPVINQLAEKIVKELS